MDQVDEALDCAAARWEAIGPGDDEDAYEPVWLALRPVASMPEAIDVAARRLGSARPADVCVALDLLSVVANGAEDSTVDRVATVLLAVPRRHHDGSPLDDDVAWSLVNALGKLWRPEGAVALADLADHPDPHVREFLASNIIGGVEHGDAVLERAVTGVLLRLMTDVDGDVRDWATFGLGEQLEVDGPDVRDALAANLTDPYGEVAGEALKGLARRHDRRALAPTLIRLEGENASRQVFASAALLAADRLAPALAAWPLDEDVEAALVTCDPARRAVREAAHWAVLAALIDLDPTIVPVLAMDAVGSIEVELRIGEASWDTDGLLERAGGDPTTAARLAMSDTE